MGRGKDLNDAEKATIAALAKRGMSIRDIAKDVERSKSAVHRFLTASKQGGIKKRAGAKPKVTGTQLRAIIRTASAGKSTAREIKHHHGCNVSVRRVQQLLQKSPHLVYRKMLNSPSLKPAHKNARVQ